MRITDSVPGHRALSLSANETLDSRQLVPGLIDKGYRQAVAEELAQQIFDLLEEISVEQRFAA